MKEKKLTLIPDIKVMHFKPDENDRLPEMERVVEDGPRYRGKTVPELKKMAKVLGLKVGGTRLELIHRIADETTRINEEKKRIAKKKKEKEDRLLQDNNHIMIENLRASIGVQEVQLKQVREDYFALVKKKDKLEAKINQLKLTLATLEETLDVPDINW
jgi:septal ring factor EnvC (AmiA/AmiB activator)